MARGDSWVADLSHQYLLQSKNYISLHVDVKERTYFDRFGTSLDLTIAGFTVAFPSRLTPRSSFPRALKMVGLIGLEPMTPALSRRCSNQLSYRPFLRALARNLKFHL